MHKLGYLRVSSRILEKKEFLRISLDQWCGTTQWAVQEAFEPALDFKESWKAYYIIAVSWVTGRRIYSSVSCWLHFLTWTIWYQCLYTKNYKAVYTYHQIFCCPESVNTKWENPMVYGASFTQCVCTGYCESWILS